MRKGNPTRKLIALFLMIAVMVSAFAGCGNGGSSDTAGDVTTKAAEKTTKASSGDANDPAPEASGEPTVITMLYSDNANYPAQDDWLILQEFKDRMNVVLDLEAVPESDFEARRTVSFNSGDMPDIISKTFGYTVSPYIAAGLFLPISDYVDQMPNYKAFIEKYDYAADLDNTREADGKYYSLPINSNTQRVNAHGWMIRMDQLDEYGLEVPTTMDEIYEASKVWKEHNPDAYPMTNRFGSANILSKVAPAFDTIAGWGLGNMFQYDAAADNFFFAPATDEYKEMLMWMNKMYEEGLLDPEFSTLDSTLYEERIKNGEQFILVDWIGNENRYNRDGPAQSGNENFNVQPMMPPKGPRGTFAGGEVNKYEQGWVINAKVAEREDFPQVLAFIDWLYSEEGAELTSFGVEGVSYEVLDSGRKEFIDFSVDYTADLGINQNALTARRDEDWFASQKSEYVVDLFSQMDAEGVFKPKQPSIVLDDLQKEEEGFYRTTLNDFVNQMTEEFIFGVASFDEWDAFVADCQSKGAVELDALYNGAWDSQK